MSAAANNYISMAVPGATASVINANSLGQYYALGAGKLILQLAGSGSVASVALNGGTAYNLNSGNALVSGALYEFEIHVVSSSDYITISGATVIRVLWVSV